MVQQVGANYREKPMSRYFLDDATMQQFITEGHVAVQADCPPLIHQTVYDKLESVFGEEGNPGNNILPRIPEIQQVYEHPAVAGALTSILGPGYLMHPHRYCHLNIPGSKGQSWHKDDYVFDQNVRRHRCRWVMAFYYPQDVTEEMGPTGVMPRTQYHNDISSNNAAEATEPAKALCGNAGTVSIVNFDMWHRATPNVSDRKRYMLKFQFTRMQEPDSATWRNEQTMWHPAKDDPHPALSESVWHWLSGNLASSNESNGHMNGTFDDLNDENESIRLNAAYALGAQGEKVTPMLIDMIRTEGEAAAEAVMAKSSANPAGGNPSDTSPVHALSALGTPAIPMLIKALQDSAWWVRSAAAEVLGDIGLPAQSAIPRLLRALQDEQVWVRRNAADALGTIGGLTSKDGPALVTALRDEDERIRRNVAFAMAKHALPISEVVSALRDALHDEGRYVQYYAAIALRRMGTPEANEALWNAMITSRWCPVTTKKSPY